MAYNFQSPINCCHSENQWQVQHALIYLPYNNPNTVKNTKNYLNLNNFMKYIYIPGHNIFN